MTSTKPFTWGATAPVGDVTEPIDAQKAAGYKKGQPDPHDEYNWLLRELGRLTRTAGGFDTLDDGAEELDAGDTGIVDEYDLDNQRGTVAQERTLGWFPGSLDVTGKSIVVADGGANAIALDRSDLTTAITGYTPTLAGAIRRIISDGVDTVLIYGVNVELFDHDTDGTVRSWVNTPGAGFTPNDVFMDANFVYVVAAAPDGAGDYLIAIDRTTGVKSWGYNHGAALHSVCGDGQQVYTGGQSGGGANTIRGLAADGSGVAWSIPAGTIGAFTGHGKMATDGQRVYIGPGGSSTLYVVSRFDGTALRNVSASPIAGDNINVIAVDQSNVYVGLGDTGGADARRLWVYDKRNLDRVYDYTEITGVTLHLPNWIASDGAALFVASNPFASGGPNLQRVYRGNRSSVWMRVDPSVAEFLPFRQVMIPEE